MAKFKNGRYSKKEIRFLTDSAKAGVTYQEIARSLNRDPEMILKKIKDLCPTLDTSEKMVSGSSAKDVTMREFWPTIQKKFNEEELRNFVAQWNNICNQFNFDILPTEEMQIIDMIELTLKIDRIHIQDKKYQDEIHKNLERIEYLERELRHVPDHTLIEEAVSLRDRNSFLTEMTSKNNRDYKDLLGQKEKLYRDLKASRGQRIDNIENRKVNFLGWLTDIAENPDKRKQMGLWMEKRRIASEMEAERLKQPHVYDDKQTDRPVLTPETVLEMRKKEQQELEDKQNENSVGDGSHGDDGVSHGGGTTESGPEGVRTEEENVEEQSGESEQCTG